jgi:hypothetical protein
MDDKAYHEADSEVIGMVNRGAGPGGELPTVTLTFIPSDRADRVSALDARIQHLRRIAPYVGAALIAFVSVLIGITI